MACLLAEAVRLLGNDFHDTSIQDVRKIGLKYYTMHRELNSPKILIKSAFSVLATPLTTSVDMYLLIIRVAT